MISQEWFKASNDDRRQKRRPEILLSLTNRFSHSLDWLTVLLKRKLMMDLRIIITFLARNLSNGLLQMLPSAQPVL